MRLFGVIMNIIIAYSLEDPLLLRLDFYEFLPKVFYTNVIKVRMWLCYLIFLLKWMNIRQYFEICHVVIQTRLQI